MNISLAISTRLTFLSWLLLTIVAVVAGAAFEFNRPTSFSLLLLAALTTLIWFDLRYTILPNLVTLPLIGIGLIWTWRSAGSWTNAIAGIIVGYLGVRLLNSAWRVFRRRDGIGQGDAKLVAAAGAWLGGLALPMVILIASVSALAYLLIIGRGKMPPMNTRIPFGPFICFAFWVCWVFPIALTF